MTIEVTKEDRGAAANFASSSGLFKSIHEVEQLVKAFACHRIAAYAEGEAAGIMLRDDYYKKVRERNAKGGGS